MRTAVTRIWLVRWLYAAAIGHLLVGVLLPWIGNLPVLDGYHRGIEAAFWGDAAPAAARAQQVWWIGLFGPTVQVVGLWMWPMVAFADKHRSATLWGWLIAGIVLWAPQDMLFSLRAHCWPHVWVDTIALLALLPPLFWLWAQDRQAGVLANQ
ncbi:hypothetical protein [Chitinimonas naiadis]